MDLGRAVESLGKALGLRSDLFARMSIEDDWSFVIKAQAILEAALTHFNTGRVNNAAVSKVLESLTVRGQRASKLALFVALGGSTQVRDFVDSLNRVRNNFAHDVQYVDHTLTDWIREHSEEKEFNSTVEKLLFRIPPTMAFRGLTMREYFEQFPREVLFVGLILSVALMFEYATPSSGQMPDISVSSEAELMAHLRVS